jgi:hypothetical protein
MGERQASGRMGGPTVGSDGDMWQRGRPLPPVRSGGMGGPGMRGGAVAGLPALHKTESAFKVCRGLRSVCEGATGRLARGLFHDACVLTPHAHVTQRRTCALLSIVIMHASCCWLLFLATVMTCVTLQAGMTVTDDPGEEAKQRTFKGMWIVGILHLKTVITYTACYFAGRHDRY